MYHLFPNKSSNFVSDAKPYTSCFPFPPLLLTPRCMSPLKCTKSILITTEHTESAFQLEYNNGLILKLSSLCKQNTVTVGTGNSNSCVCENGKVNSELSSSPKLTISSSLLHLSNSDISHFDTGVLLILIYYL